MDDQQNPIGGDAPQDVPVQDPMAAPSDPAGVPPTPAPETPGEETPVEEPVSAPSEPVDAPQEPPVQ